MWNVCIENQGETNGEKANGGKANGVVLNTMSELWPPTFVISSPRSAQCALLVLHSALCEAAGGEWTPKLRHL